MDRGFLSCARNMFHTLWQRLLGKALMQWLSLVEPLKGITLYQPLLL